MKKLLASVCILVCILAVACFAGLLAADTANVPKLDTVEKCRAYREASNASAQEDVKTLTVRQLLDRSEQMMNCPLNVDVQPLKAGMPTTEAMQEVTRHSSYAILSSGYQHEVIARLTWFLERRGLTKGFLSEDEKSLSPK
jgi:hypothetical protein